MFCDHSNKINPTELHFQQLIFSKTLELGHHIVCMRQETFRKVVETCQIDESEFRIVRLRDIYFA
jgi:hypothetical protein